VSILREANLCVYIKGEKEDLLIGTETYLEPLLMYWFQYMELYFDLFQYLIGGGEIVERPLLGKVKQE
jgi:hypothetical protein